MLEWIQENYGIIVPSGYITYMPDSKDRFRDAVDGELPYRASIGT